jgi:hypothetical protein
MVYETPDEEIQTIHDLLFTAESIHLLSYAVMGLITRLRISEKALEMAVSCDSTKVHSLREVATEELLREGIVYKAIVTGVLD